MGTAILFIIGLFFLVFGIVGWGINVWNKIPSSFKAHSYALYPFLLGLCIIIAAISRMYALNS